jgi:low temperature requirement protein LtrA
MGVLFLIWWWYFDGASAASEQPVRNRRDAIRFHIWSYAHFPLYLGIIVAGVGVQRSVTAATWHALSSQESLIFAGAVVLMMLAMSAIDAASAARPADSRRLAAHLAVAGALAVIGATGVAAPLAMISAVFAACAAQLVLSLGGSSGLIPRPGSLPG